MNKLKIIFSKNTTASILGIAAVIFLFVLMSFVATRYEKEIYALAGNGGFFGMVSYVIITIVAVVVAPISAAPLIPVASHIWGWFGVAILSIIGWSIGAQIAFYIARYFGKPFVEKLISMEKINNFENYFPKLNTFWAVVFFRMAMPVDILSYALGLFSQISASSYFLATLIGITPFAFIFAYAGTLSVGLQIAALLVGFIIIFIGYLIKNGSHTQRG